MCVGSTTSFIGNMYRMIDYSRLNLVNGYPKHSRNGSTSQCKILTILNFNSGKTYLFHNDTYYAESDECTVNINFGI